MKRAAALICMLAFTVFCLAGCGSSAVSSETVTSANTDAVLSESVEEAEEDPPELQITVLDVGQGLSVLIRSNGEYALYDGGGRQHSSYVVASLKDRGVDAIKYLFASHYDEDHIAGLVGVLKTTPVSEAIIPDYESDTEIYASFMSATEAAETVTYASTGECYSLGNAEITVLYATDGTEEAENDKSTVISVSMGEFSCIITGDAEYSTETKMLENGVLSDCDVYVVGHHGSSSSSSPEFVAEISPEAAIISVGADNSYGHPTEETLSTLSDCGAAIYRTDLSGYIEITSDGEDFTVSEEHAPVAPTVQQSETEEGSENEEESGTEEQPETEEQSETEVPEGVTYVLNNNSWKFHLPDCDAVSKIAEYNKEYSYASREELIEQGYAPCGWCNP